MNWIYIVVIVVVLIAMYAFMIYRNRKQQKINEEIMNSFQVGDKVVTHIGIFGRIKKIYNTSYGKVCVLEVGNNNKLDIEVDMRVIAQKDEKVLVADEPAEKVETAKVEDKKENNEQTKNTVQSQNANSNKEQNKDVKNNSENLLNQQTLTKAPSQTTNEQHTEFDNNRVTTVNTTSTSTVSVENGVKNIEVDTVTKSNTTTPVNNQNNNKKHKKHKNRR